MKARARCLLSIWLLVLARMQCLADNPQSGIAFGLTNLALGQALLSTDAGSAVVSELSSNGTDGLSILLGEADSGVFVSPDTVERPEAGDYMVGKAYGRLNGVDNQLICTTRARTLNGSSGFGIYPVQVDFSPLGVSNLLFQVFDGNQLVSQTTNVGGEAVVRTDFNGGRVQRVNPYWRLPDGTFGAQFEFDAYTGYNFPGNDPPDDGPLTIFGNRLVIRPLNSTSVVEFLSRVDVTSGGTLESWGDPSDPPVGDGLSTFQFDDIRLGVFGRPHRALAFGALQAAGGRLTIRNYALETNAHESGVSVELDQVGRFDASLVPVELATNGATLTIDAIGVLTWANYVLYAPGYSLGFAQISRTDDSLLIHGSFPAISTNTPRVQIAIYSNNTLVATSAVMAYLPPVALSGQPRVRGGSAFAHTLDSLPGLAFQFDRSTVFTFTYQAATSAFEGDEIRFFAVDPAQFPFNRTKFLSGMTAFNLTAAGLAPVTILSESSQPRAEPLLRISRSANEVAITWPDPNQEYYLQAAESFGGEFGESNGTLDFSGGVFTLRFDPSTSSQQFFRLVHLNN